MFRYGCKKVDLLLFGQEESAANQQEREQEALRKHLERCSACRKRARRLGVPERYRELLQELTAGN